MNMLKKISNRLYKYSIEFTNWRINYQLKHFPSIATTTLKRKNVIKGSSALLKKGIFIEDYRNVEIGDGCAINSNVRFYIEGKGNPKIYIGKNVFIARDVIFETGTHNIGNPVKRCADSYSKDIKIGDGTWIGLGSIILPGVVIGSGCIIQAGSVITKRCKDNCIYGGNPAKKLVDLSQVSALK